MKNVYKTLGSVRGLKSKLVLPLFFAAALLFLGHPALAQSTNYPSGYCGTSHQYMNNNGCYQNYGFNFLMVKMDDTWTHNVTCNSGTVYRYWNNLGAVATLSQGSDHTMQMQTQSTTYRTSAAAWIDFNQDGTFQPSEFLGTAQTGTSAPTFTKNFTVPCNAVPGNTIMRVRCDYNTAIQAGDACGQKNYGETMDYIVTITSTGTPTADFNFPDTIYTNSPAVIVNSNPEGYISHEWDIIGQGNTPDGTGTNFSYTFPTAGNYQLKLTSTNCTGSASTTKNFTVHDPTSAPRALFIVSQNEAVYDGSNPVYVDMYDLSQYGASSWYWTLNPDFLNGAPWLWSIGSNTSRNPQAFFYDVEDYDVCLVVSNAVGSDTACKSDYIKILDPSAVGGFENILGQQGGSTLDSGVIYDSGGPDNNYGANEYHTFTIAPCGADDVTLHFQSFNLQDNRDYLKIYDGPTTASPQIANLTGTNIPNSVTASSGTMTLLFTSDANTHASGFEARWNADIPNNGAPTADFTMPDTVYECTGGTEVNFMDASTGILPTQGEYEWIFDYDPNVSYPSGYYDIMGETAPSWSYSSPGTYDVRMVLKTCEGNDTAVKTVLIAATNNNPMVDFSSSEKILKVGGTAVLTSEAVAACSYKWEITPAGSQFINGTQDDDRVIELKFNSPGSYHIKLTATNDNGSTVEEKTNFIDVVSYCRPVASLSSISDLGISRVTMENIDNQSDPTTNGGFYNYSVDHAAKLTVGDEYSVTVTRNTNVNAVERKVWIDYNRDGDFDDQGELVASESNSSNRTFTASFTVPSIDVVIPGETRMRIGSALGGSSLPPCGPTQAGEYEDYGIFLELDDQAPIITMIGGDTLIEKNTTYTDPGATAFDNIEGVIAVDVDENVDESQTGIYYVTYSAVDGSGNPAPLVIRKVTVVEDLTAPTITLNGANPYIHSVLIPFVDPMATATDQPSGANISGLIKTTDNIDVNMIGNYTVTYEVVDNYGNVSTVTRDVLVRDTTAPMFNANTSYNIQVNQPFMLPFTLTDNYDANAQLTVVNGFVNTSVVGSYDVLYAAVDASGNAAQNIVVTYNVNDYIAPSISFVPNTDEVTVDVFDNDWYKDPVMQVNATDNYFSSVSMKMEFSSGYNIGKLGTYEVTYRATDAAGNESTFVRTVNVVDREAPQINAITTNLPRWTTFDLLDEGLNVVDNYNQPNDFRPPFNNGCELKIVRSNLDLNYPGIYQVVYVAIDQSGNVSEEVTRVISVSAEGINTSIDGADLSAAMSVYPNPNAGVFTLQVDAVLDADASIEILNAVGKVVMVINPADLKNGKLELDMEEAASGVYFVRVSSAEQVATKKIVINR